MVTEEEEAEVNGGDVHGNVCIYGYVTFVCVCAFIIVIHIDVIVLFREMKEEEKIGVEGGGAFYVVGEEEEQCKFMITQ